MAQAPAGADLGQELPGALAPQGFPDSPKVRPGKAPRDAADVIRRLAQAVVSAMAVASAAVLVLASKLGPTVMTTGPRLQGAVVVVAEEEPAGEAAQAAARPAREGPRRLRA